MAESTIRRAIDVLVVQTEKLIPKKRKLPKGEVPQTPGPKTP